MKTFSDIIDLWPGDTPRERLELFASDMDVKYNTARGWYNRNSIPNYYWTALIHAGRHHYIDIDADLLLSIVDNAYEQ